MFDRNVEPDDEHEKLAVRFMKLSLSCLIFSLDQSSFSEARKSASTSWINFPLTSTSNLAVSICASMTSRTYHDKDIENQGE